MVAQQLGRRGARSGSRLASMSCEGPLQHRRRAGGAFRGLQRDIAGKPVDDHVDIAARQVVALDEADGERRLRRPTAHPPRPASRCPSHPRSDIEQATAARGQHDPRIGRAHYRELDEVAGVALGTGAEIDHICHPVSAAARRARAGRCRAACATRLGHRHQRAGVAGRNGAIGRSPISRLRSPALTSTIRSS